MLLAVMESVKSDEIQELQLQWRYGAAGRSDHK